MPSLPTGEGGNHPREYKMEDYTLTQRAFHQAVEALGVGSPTVDVSASKENTRCPEFWDEGVDAFTQPWKQGRVLWINPPSAVCPGWLTKLSPRRCDASWFAQTGQRRNGLHSHKKK